MNDIPPSVLAALEGKNHELKQARLAVRAGDLYGSCVADITRELDRWTPEQMDPEERVLHDRISQIVAHYRGLVEAVRAESGRAPEGVVDPFGTPRQEGGQ